MNNKPQYIWPSKLQASNPDDAKVLHTAQTIYSEFAGVKDQKQMSNYMKMGASSAYNLYNKKEYSGLDYDTYLYKRFNAINRPNANTPDAMNGTFDTPQKQYAWKKAMQTAYGVANGLIDSDKTQFYFTNNEVSKLKEKGNFDFNKVQPVGKVGKYQTFAYKD